jgi:hypothetical protein
VERERGHGAKPVLAEGTVDMNRGRWLTLLARLLAEEKELSQQSDVYMRSDASLIADDAPHSEGRRINVSPKRPRSDDMVPPRKLTNKKRKAAEGSSDRDMGKRKTIDEVRSTSAPPRSELIITYLATKWSNNFGLPHNTTAYETHTRCACR